MPNMSQRLREPLVLTILVLAIAGWLAFLAVWINSSGQSSNLQNQVSTLTSERDSLRGDLTLREQSDGALADVEAELATLQQQRDEAAAALETANTDLDARRSELDTTTQDLATRRSEAGAFEEDLASATAQTEELAARQAALQAEISSSNQQLLDVGTRLEEARRQEETAAASLAKIAEEAAAATASLAETQSELQSSRNELNTAQQELADSSAQTEAARTQVADLHAQSAELEARQAQLQNDVNGYQEQLTILQPQVEELTATLAQRSSELQNVETEIARSVAIPDTETSSTQVGTIYSVGAEGPARGLSLTLNDDETFELRDRINRTVTGSYTLSQDELVLSDASGRLGNATFPMTCPLEQDETGFTIGEAADCPLTGLRFDRVEPETAE
ncbi:coiled-coil domain-containing protein [Devosia aurantiaca]|uniref:Chromosome partitioning protein ParA n=1 Tax=Devosia aurantiaca TaxID=2714858 RepID=A0A6M1SP82_9HYPH|nr:hypothetical protein [Devosia aurantiaca]NGP18484.1 hypothetical protein [Devosia aurantiaca]